MGFECVLICKVIWGVEVMWICNVFGLVEVMWCDVKIGIGCVIKVDFVVCMIFFLVFVKVDCDFVMLVKSVIVGVVYDYLNKVVFDVL